MRKRVLILTTTAAILACGSAASAQAPGAQGPSTQQSSTTQPISDPVLQEQNQN